jgi:hypothetical protein
MFKKGRFRPATFWKTSALELASSAVHRDRTLLTTFRRKEEQDDGITAESIPKMLGNCWHVLNCHLQAGKQAQRRVRQINEGVRSCLTLARKLKGEYCVWRSTSIKDCLPSNS